MQTEKFGEVFGEMTRSKLIQMWFATVLIVAGATLAFGGSVSVGTGALLLALCLVPPAIVVVLWPDAQPQTIAEILHDTERRP